MYISTRFGMHFWPHGESIVQVQNTSLLHWLCYCHTFQVLSDILCTKKVVNDFVINSYVNACTFCMVSLLMPICVTQLCHCVDFKYIIEHILVYDIRFKKLVTYFRKKNQKIKEMHVLMKLLFVWLKADCICFHCKWFLISWLSCTYLLFIYCLLRLYFSGIIWKRLLYLVSSELSRQAM